MSLESWMRLALAPEIGPVLGHRLLTDLGSPEAVFAAHPERLRQVPGLGPARLAALLGDATARAAREEVERAHDAGVCLLTPEDPDYPALLLNLPYHPLMLWVRGRLAPVDRLAVAVVGPRSPSSYARLMSDALVQPLAAAGLTIVSGLAHGVDALAHRAALEAGGRTLAVLGQGLGNPIYPQNNAELAERIVEEDRGALISIFPLLTEPSPGLFPLRNEVVAALALGVLVVEASPSSGALITARHAAALGRTVLACPGDATRRAAHGSNRLIADGAALAQVAEDVLGALSGDLRRERQALGEGSAENVHDDERRATENGAAGAAHAPALAQASLDGLSRLLVDLLGEEPRHADWLLQTALEAGHPVATIMEKLLYLEMDGFVRQLPGRLYALSPVWR